MGSSKGVPDRPRQRVTAWAGRRLFLAASFLLLILSLVFSVGVLWPHVVLGHARLEPWAIVPLYLADGVAFYWFYQFFRRHVILGQELRDLPLAEFRKRGGYRTVWLTLLGAVVLDGLHTLHQGSVEWSARQRAHLTQGEVVEVSKQRTAAGFSYWAPYAFRDRQGHSYSGILLTEEKDGDFVDDVPQNVQMALRNQQVPFVLNVHYDPEWPGRNWPSEATRVVGIAHVLVFGMCTGFIQLCFLPAWVATLAEATKDKGIVPWWHELLALVPLLVEAVLLLLAAILVLAN